MSDDINDQTAAPVYPIREVMDFLKVPADRRDDCLHEFAAWLATADFMGSLLKGIEAKLPETFVWIDDGKRNLVANILAGETKIAVFKATLNERLQETRHD